MSQQVEKKRANKGSMFNGTAEFALGLAVGIGTGYLIGKELSRKFSRRQFAETHLPKVADPYAMRSDEEKFLANAPEIYRNIPFMEGIISATGLQEDDQGRNIAEFMSGTGKVGRKIDERFPGNVIWYIDTSEAQLTVIPDQQHIIRHDVRKGLPSELPKLDGVVIRFGVKNLLQEEQQRFVSDVADKLIDGGWLVIADMVSPDGLQEWHNAERRLKHELEGHDVERDGAGNIPYRDEWVALLENAGFAVEFLAPYKSEVNTNDWNDQFAGNEIQRETAVQQMNKMLLIAPDNVKQAFNIHKDGDEVRIDYPLLVIRAKKGKNSRR